MPHELILESIASDSAKHERVLRFTAERVKAQGVEPATPGEAGPDGMN